MQALLLDGRSREQRIEAAIKLLRENGYSVRGPLLPENEVMGMTVGKFIRYLRSYFFDRMAAYNPDDVVGYSGNEKEDLAIARDFFLRVVQDSGVSETQAMVQCLRLVDAMFQYESSLGLDRRITSMRVLADSEKVVWIVERAKNIVNRVDNAQWSAEEQAWYEELYRRQEASIYASEGE